jgi:hypothetical protein
VADGKAETAAEGTSPAMPGPPPAFRMLRLCTKLGLAALLLVAVYWAATIPWARGEFAIRLVLLMWLSGPLFLPLLIARMRRRPPLGPFLVAALLLCGALVAAALHFLTAGPGEALFVVSFGPPIQLLCIAVIVGIGELWTAHRARRGGGRP